MEILRAKIDINKKRSGFIKQIVVYLTSLCVNWAFFGTSGPIYTRTS
jgi:hypothetical protein